MAISRRLVLAWLIAGVPSGLSMVLSYWALQYINSGVAAVFLGLAPMFTGLLAWACLNDRPSAKELAYVTLGLVGLLIIFQDSFQSGHFDWLGMSAAIAAVLMMAVGAVMLKRFGCDLPADAINNGALLVRALITGSAWLLSGAPLPTQMPSNLACGATLYMAVIGSVVAFTVHIRLMQTYRPITCSSIFVITPAFALWLGHSLNAEVVSSHMIVGTGMVLFGLALFLMQQQRRQLGLLKVA